jgi:hypothetical protein
MALDILSIPAMSAEPERLFSGAKITISDRRCRLKTPIIQALECLKSWLGLIDAQNDNPEGDDNIRGEGNTVDNDIIEVEIETAG